jgi:hypothetical protein
MVFGMPRVLICCSGKIFAYITCPLVLFLVVFGWQVQPSPEPFFIKAFLVIIIIIVIIH